VLNGRLYRAALAPLLLAVAIAAFSLSGEAGPYTSTLAPDAFNGQAAYAELQSLAARFPRRRPGGAGDAGLAAYIAQVLRGLGGSAAGGFSVQTRTVGAQTIDGQRTLTTVIATRSGTTGAAPLVLLAHRDAAGYGARAALSGTAVLLELARVFAASETHRTLILVSTSGGSGGDAGAADYAAHAAAGGGGGGGSADAALVLGDLAGAVAHKPFVVPFSDGVGGASVALQRTVAGAIAQEVGADPGTPGTLSQLAHLTFPLTLGEQGPLNAHGTPAVLVQVSGERGPSPHDPVSATRLQNFGRAVLGAVYALDGAPDLQGGAAQAQSGVPLQHKTLPEWAVRLLLAALLAPVLLVAVDGLARLRRRRVPLARWLAWALACAAPSLLCVLFVRLLGLGGALAAPAGLVPAGALPGGHTAWETVLAPALVLVAAWLCWPVAMRRLGLPTRADSDAAGLAVLLLLLGVAAVVWLVNPYAALLLVPALHLWLLVVSPEWRVAGGRAHRVRALAVVALGLAPLALLVLFYARELGFDVGQAAHAAVLLTAGGYVSIVGLLLWSLAFGGAAGMTLVALSRPPPLVPGGSEDDRFAITVRGPMSYAGPGSLGGTESALRR
jgi:Peptidase family M28